ncbi:MAG: Serine-tRNA ligase, partial [Candidatus Gottesmanbacteria bacterium GW2011_GWA1_34_13]
ENPELVKKGVTAKGYSSETVDEVIKLDVQRRNLIGQSETLRAQRNQLTKNDIEKGKLIKQQLKNIEPELKTLEIKLAEVLNTIPNLPFDFVPQGKGEQDNVEVKKWGDIREFSFSPKDHLELGKNLNILDFETGAKVVGSNFYYLYRDGAMLELALVSYAMKLLEKEGFIPVITPDLAKPRFYLGTGYAPRGKEAQTYVVSDETGENKLGLIATAEVTLAGKHADEIIPVDKLPLKYVGYSHCFRQEGGSYGKYSRGLYRVHQFTKVEMFIYCTSEESNNLHEYILSLEEKIYQNLGIPYRILEMCSGDLGAMAARKFDIEAWMPGRNDYGEVTSTSNCTDYQARNLNIKYKTKEGNTAYVHMLNGTALATSRLPIAIMENYQNEDGSISIPDELQTFMGKEKILP